jgi:hypothetical protein
MYKPRHFDQPLAIVERWRLSDCKMRAIRLMCVIALFNSFQDLGMIRDVCGKYSVRI